MNTRKWLIKESDRELCSALEGATGLKPLTVRLLVNRGIDTPEKIKTFLEKYDIPLYDPFLMKDMDKAVARIRTAIEKKERVCIYGDYDVDGVTSTVMLYSYLKSKGLECDYFIPERLSEGYGLSLPVIEKMKGHVDLIITVDTGVTALEEADYAASIGIDMVITDHHSVREKLPKAAAVVNPHREDDVYPFKNLAGVGVVFKLLCALEGSTEKILSLYSDIIAVGTIADVMPIVDENRRITAVGLKKLTETDNIGLLALMRQAGIIKPGKNSKKVTSATVGYVLAPRINAAGRIAFASRAVELLLAANEREADEIALELCEINKLRQSTEQKIFEQAIELINSRYSDDKFIVLAYDGWHQGVIGVVASKIAEKYSRPCILFSLDGDTAKGSGRSIKGFSLMDALSACGDVLIEYGGHELAAGLSVERARIDEFRRRINEYAEPLLDVSNAALPLEIDCEAGFTDISAEGVEELLKLEPFGLSNPQPLLLMRDAEIKDIVPLSMGKHVKFRLCGGNSSVSAVYFGMSVDSFPFCEGDKCDIVFNVDMNDYMGIRTPQVFVKSMMPSRSTAELSEKGMEAYERMMSGKMAEEDAANIPDLSCFRNVFRCIKRDSARDGGRISVQHIINTLRDEYLTPVTVCQLLIVLDVLFEQGLIDYKNYNGISVFIKMLPTSAKINIDESELLKRLRREAGEI